MTHRIRFALLAALLMAPAITRGADAPSVLCINNADPIQPDYAGGPLLIREFVRQALFTIAREDLHAATRDQALGEPVPAAGVLQLNLEITGPRPVKAKITFPGGKVMWEGILSEGDWWDEPLAVFDASVKLAKTTWLDSLKSAGLSARPPPTTAAAAAQPSAIEENLATLELLSQYSALRQLHEKLAAAPSPQLTGDLIRAYANLGQLTTFHWTANYKVFTARALVYADRFVAADPKSANGLWHRAYARALAGFQGAALDDISAAKALGGDAPKWAKLLEPFCHYDTGAVVNIAGEDQSLAPLASFLAYLSVAYCDTQGATVTFARTAGELNPECLRLLDDLCANTGPGPLNSLTEIAPQIFGQTLAKRLEKLPNCPEPLKKLIAESRRPQGIQRGRNQVIDTLTAEGDVAKDSGEPSWAVLADLIRQTTFVHVARRADLIAHKWGVDASGYVAEQLPLIEGHPYAKYIASLGRHPGVSNERIFDEMRGMNFNDVTLAADLMFGVLNRSGMTDSYNHPIGMIAWTHSDGTSFEISQKLHRYKGVEWENRDSNIARLKRVSPDSPLAIGNELCWHWDQVKDKAAGWEKSHGSHPEVARELGIAYLKIKQWDDAERNLRKLIAVAPDQDGYYNLAYLYEQKGEPAKAIDALKEFCEKCEDFGLQHAQAQVRIAEYYISKGDLQQAVKYADQAAETRAAWATACAQRAHELAGDFDVAEQWVAERSQHYSNNGTDWYFWCQRTGRGNMDAAKAVADQFVAAYQSSPNYYYQYLVADVYFLEGKLEEARDAYRKSFDARPDPVVALYIAMICDQLKDPAGRDQILAAAKDKAADAVDPDNRKRVETFSLVNMISDAFTKNQPLDPKKIDSLFLYAPDGERANIRYFAAWYFRNHDQPDVAKKLLVDSVREDHTPRFASCLTWMEVRKLGEDPIALQLPQATNAPAKPAPAKE